MAKKKDPAASVFTVIAGIKLPQEVIDRISRRVGRVVAEEMAPHAYLDTGHSIVEFGICIEYEGVAESFSGMVEDDIMDCLKEQGYEIINWKERN